MYFYFSSDCPAAIKVNGLFYGILSSDIKPLRVDCGAPFVEICPVHVNQPCVNLLLDQNFLDNPPLSITLTDLKGGYLVKFSQTIINTDFFVLAQHKAADFIATVFNENGLKLSIETKSDFYAETIPLAPSSASIKEFYQDNCKFIAVELFGGSTTLFIYKISDKVEKLFCRQVDSFSVENGLSTIEKFSDIAKHTVTSFWKFDKNVFIRDNYTVTCSNEFNPENTPEQLVPYCFVESYMVGEDTQNYLCENIIENYAHLKKYFGDYIGIMPPPKFRSIDEIGLIYPQGGNKYVVEYFKFELKNKKISNIIKCD